MKKTVTILLLIALLIALCSCSVNVYTYSDSRRYTAGDAVVTDPVKTLDVSWIDGQVTIGYHSGNGVLVTDENGARLSKADRLHWWLDGSTLYVKYAESGVRLDAGLDKALTILLPAGMQLEHVEINVVSSDLDVDGLVAKDVKINTVSGRVNMTAARMATAKIDTVSGRVTLSCDSAVEKVSVNSVSGGVVVNCEGEPEVIDVTTVSGEVTIALPESAGFTLNADSVSGRVSGSMDMTVSAKNRYVHGDGACRIDVDTVSGDIRMDVVR